MIRLHHDATTRTLLVPGRNCWTVAPAESSGLLVDAADYYSTFYHCARQARRTILMAGWQFDSTVELLRGPDRADARAPDVALLAFLDRLCARNPDLRVYILEWNYNPIFVFQREILQTLKFSSTRHRHILLRFDDRHAIGASHHQKFVIVDRDIAFLGGTDICEHRWDDRRHLAENPLRAESDGTPYGPYHEAHAYMTGPVVDELIALFRARWRMSGGTDIEEPASPPRPLPVKSPGLPLGPARVGLSLTLGRTFEPPQGAVRQIRRLYLDAIDAAEEFIYIENQYFSSRAVYKALVRRMEDPRRTKLDIVLIYPKENEAFTEELAVGFAQRSYLRHLKDVSVRTGHALGIFYTASLDRHGDEAPRYIHSKILIVDDRLLTIGSANTTNRSLGVDSELNACWDATGDLRLAQAIRAARVDLLAEHAGVSPDRLPTQGRGLVEALTEIAREPQRTIFPHPMACNHDSYVLSIDALDPEGALLDEEGVEASSTSFFLQALPPPNRLWMLLITGLRVTVVLIVGAALIFLLATCLRHLLRDAGPEPPRKAQPVLSSSGMEAIPLRVLADHSARAPFPQSVWILRPSCRRTIVCPRPIRSCIRRRSPADAVALRSAVATTRRNSSARYILFLQSRSRESRDDPGGSR
ncbi:MAG: phospholipase [Planctomycetes bacterium]|nr:phospholipase [Planctomycetota bacterium]